MPTKRYMTGNCTVCVASNITEKNHVRNNRNF